MVFSSHVFLFYFLPVTLVLYALAPRPLRHPILTALSYAFYGWANPLFLPLLLGSTLVDYGCGLAIADRGPVWLARVLGRTSLAERWRRPLELSDPADPRGRGRRRIAVTLSVVTNLSLLGFFKYFNFGVDTLNDLAAWTGATSLGVDTALRVTLPLGISFYTFQSMSYTIDVARGHAVAVRRFIDFACYVSMFPQLVAGPIIRFSEVADQLAHRTHTVTKCARGVMFVCLGLAKKVLIANPCGRVADLAFDAGHVAPLDAWYGATAYAFQIYFDFSGYSDMAIGLGLMLGFVFPKNFDSPYRARSVTEFWRRWHLSLSSWLRDYLYVPLGGSRRGPARTYLNLAIVMLLGGLWHGASWTFVIWGALHGGLLALERAIGRRRRRIGGGDRRGARAPSVPVDVPGGRRRLARVPDTLRTAGTFVVLLLTWVFFRAADLPSAGTYFQSLFGLRPVTDQARLLSAVLWEPYSFLTVVGAAIIIWTAPQTWDWTRHLTVGKAAVALGLLVCASGILATQAHNPFLYFIF